MFLGIDLGSTFFKTELLDADGRRMGQGAAAVDYARDEAGRVVIPIEAAEQAFTTAVADALRQAGVVPEHVAALAITSQAQTFTFRDAAGRAGSPFVSWRDPGPPTPMSGGRLKDFARHTSFGHCLPGLTVSQVAHWPQASQVRSVRADDALRWLPTWFVENMTGQAVVDDNLAGMSGLYSLVLRDWWPAALQWCGLERTQLPSVRSLGEPAGRTTPAARVYGLPAGIPVILAGNDQTAGAYAANIHASQSVFISLGTAQVAYACMSTMPEADDGRIRGPYPGGRYYSLYADSCGSGTITWAREQRPEWSDVKAFDAAAANAPAGCHGVRFLADDATGMGRWVGLDNPGVTPADQARAVFETLVERLAARVGRLSPTPDTSRRFVLTGGGAASRVWREMLAARLPGDWMNLPDIAPARGAAQLAADAGSQAPAEGAAKR